MSAALPLRLVCIEPNGTIWQHVGNETGTVAVLRSTTETYDYPGQRLHGAPAEIRCPLSWLIPAGAIAGAAGASGEVAPSPHARPAPGADSPGNAGGTLLAVAALTGTAAGAVSPAAPAAPNRNARNNDPDTAHEAADSITEQARRNAHALILRSLFEHGPQTDWQLGQKLGLLATSAGKRRGELRDMGLVVQTQFRGPTETGTKKAWRWALTDAGQAEVAA